MHQPGEAGKALEALESEGVTYHLRVPAWKTGGGDDLREMLGDKGVHYSMTVIG